MEPPSPSSSPSPSPHLLVLLATEAMDVGAEVFVDYRLDVDGISEGPVWYDSVDDSHLPKWG